MIDGFKQSYSVRKAIPWAVMVKALLLATSMAWIMHGQEIHVPPSQISGIDVSAHGASGAQLFTDGEFGGNGRTCVTCHSLRTGDITLERIQARFAENPGDPLFRPIDSDGGAGVSYSRLLTHGTFRVFVQLPSNIQLADDPGASRVALFRSTLPTNNIALDPFIMWDGREPDLPHQAFDALVTHSQITERPTPDDLQRIADFQTHQLFSSRALANFAGGAPPPFLPEGRTESERRGRGFFVPKPGVVNCSSATAARC